MKTISDIILFTIFLTMALEMRVISVADEPPIRISSPDDGAVFLEGEAIQLQVEFSSPMPSNIEKIEFLGSTPINLISNGLYTYSWSNPPAGIHSIRARVSTAAGFIESWKSTLVVLPQLKMAREWYVDLNNQSGVETGSEAQPFITIQEAVDAAQSGDTIKVARGEYREAVRVLEKNLRLQGGYAGASTQAYAQGSLGDFTTRSPRTTQIIREGADPVLEVDFNGNIQWSIVNGFTISGGQLGVRAHTFENSAGKYFLFMNNTVTDIHNRAGWVAGVAVIQVGAAVLGNTLIGNSALAYAGLYLDGNANTVSLVKDNLVDGNISTEDWSHAAGIAFRGRNATGTVTRNVVRNNRAFYGSGIFVDGDGGPNSTRLSFNSVTRNKGFFGSGEFIDGGAFAIVENETIAWNEAINEEFGGAFAVDSGPATRVLLKNCTIAFNAGYYDEFSGGNGLVISEDDGGDAVTVEVMNTIFWRNARLPGGKEINAPGNGLLKIEYSIVDQLLVANEHLQVGDGILQTDPLFADPDNLDFHLRSRLGRWTPQGMWFSDNLDSPGLDAGNPNSSFSHELIPNGGRTNLGAWGNTAEASLSGNRPATGRLSILLLPGGTRQIMFTGPLGSYQLQTANSFESVGTLWTNHSVFTNSNGMVVFQDQMIQGSTQFYRAVGLD